MIKKDAHPLLRIEYIFNTLDGSKFFTALDFAMGYHQVAFILMTDKTAFSTPFGLFQYTLMLFGLATAPATFMCLMTIFSGMLYSTCFVYLNDIFMFGRTFNEHLERLDFAHKRLKKDNFKMKPSKFSFGRRSVMFLGHIITDKGISTDLVKLTRIQELPWTRNKGEIRSSFGYKT